MNPFPAGPGGALCSLLLLAGCIVLVPKGENPLATRLMTREGLEDYSEGVFRRQNRVMTRLMMASVNDTTLSTSSRLRLERAEHRMIDACAPLNEVAGARSQGQNTSLRLENDVRQTVRDCAAATDRMEKLLDELKIRGR